MDTARQQQLSVDHSLYQLAISRTFNGLLEWTRVTPIFQLTTTEEYTP